MAQAPPPRLPQEQEEEHWSSPQKDPRAPRTIPEAALPESSYDGQHVSKPREKRN